VQRASSHTRPWRLFPLATLVALGALLPPGAAAVAPIHDRFPVEGEFDWQPLTDACGFPVTAAFEGTFDFKLFTKRDGSAREIDTQPGTKVTFSSASGAVTMPFSATLHVSYPEGTDIGAPAIATLTGRSLGQPPASGPGRGRLVMTGTVEDTEDGIPLTRFTELVSASGNFVDAADGICAALAG
jgi:hypothetical protein